MFEFVGHETSKKTTTNPVLFVAATSVLLVFTSSSLIAMCHTVLSPSQLTRGPAYAVLGAGEVRLRLPFEPHLVTVSI